MVNLLVVALLLTSCLADTIEIDRLRLECKRQDGGEEELFYQNAVIRTVEDGIGMHNSSSGFTWNAHSVHKDIQLFERKSIFLDHVEKTHIPEGQKVEIVFNISCSKKYRHRTRCPGVNNLCTGSHKKYIPIVLDYNNLKDQLKGQVTYFLATATHHEIIPDDNRRERKPMTKDEYCAIPVGMYISCNFREWPDNSSPELKFSIHLLCKKRDGSYIPLIDNKVYLRFLNSGLGIRKIAQGYGIDNEVEYTKSDKQGAIEFSETFFQVGYGEILINIHCGDTKPGRQPTYIHVYNREQCPSIEKLCTPTYNGEELETKKLSFPFDEFKKFNGGYFALTAANRFDLVHSMAELNTEPIDASGYVKEEFF